MAPPQSTLVGAAVAAAVASAGSAAAVGNEGVQKPTAAPLLCCVHCCLRR